MTECKIIAIVGMCGSGKSVLADELVKRGWGYVRFGQLTIDIIKERGLEVNEANEKSVRENLRKEHGMTAYAKLNIPKFDTVLEKQNLIADGLYSWDEYKVLKDYYNDRLTVVCVYAPPKLRYERLEKRKIEANDKDVKNRPLTKEQAKARDYAEIENLDKGGPIAMADYMILNTSTLEDYKKQIEEFLTTCE
ncbi:MAG: AAA family ATPase [Candidatus Magasanikbacteria bacterium]|nr:AAA family ATPase [Candidatus Magasanikbacteria bacterium]